MYSHVRELKSPHKSNLPSLDPETNYKISSDMEPNDEKNTDSGGDKSSGNVGNSVSGLPALGQLNAADNDDDDGFKTPTSSEHRIPVCTECPPAPKKKKRARPSEEESTLFVTKRGRMISDEEVSFWFFGMESKAAV